MNCQQGTHVIQKVPEGLYVCISCGHAFHEHHTITLAVGTGSRPTSAPTR